MKSLLYTFLILISIPGFSKKAKIKILLDRNNTSLQMEVSSPVANGTFCTNNFTNLSSPGKSHKTFSFDLDQPGFLYFHAYDSIHIKQLIYVEPEKTVEFKINDQNELEFYGDLKNENRFIQKYHPSKFPFVFVQQNRYSLSLSNLNNPEELVEKTKTKENQLQDLMQEESMNENFQSHFLTEIRYFHLASIHHAIMVKFRGYYPFNREKHSEFQNNFQPWLQLLNSIHTHGNVKNPTAKYSPSYQNFLYGYVGFFQLFVSPEFDEIKKNHSEIFLQEMELARNLLDPDELQIFHQYQLMLYVGNSSYYGNELIQHFEDYRSNYPESPVNEVLLPHMAKLERHLEKKPLFTGTTTPPVILGSENEFQELNAVLENIDEDVVLVDLWATWCQPCLREFPYYEPIYQMIDKNENIAILYISFDKNEQKAKWENYINNKNLSGYHVLASDDLKNDIRHQLNTKGFIPHYAIIKNKNVVKIKAPRPSQGTKLKDELTYWLKKD